MPFILGDDVQTLCDANYVNNAGVRAWDGGIEVRIYPAGTSRFTIFDGTEVNSTEGAGSTSVTITSQRPRPAAVRRDGTALPEVASPTAFEAADPAWRFDTALGFVLVKFSHPGDTTTITL